MRKGNEHESKIVNKEAPSTLGLSEGSATSFRVCVKNEKGVKNTKHSKPRQRINKQVSEGQEKEPRFQVSIHLAHCDGALPSAMRHINLVPSQQMRSD